MWCTLNLDRLKYIMKFGSYKKIRLMYDAKNQICDTNQWDISIISTKKVSVLWKDLIDWKWYDSKVLLISSKIYEAAVWNTNYLQITKCIKIMMVSFYFGEGKMQFLCPSTKKKIKKVKNWGNNERKLECTWTIFDKLIKSQLQTL